MSATSHFKLRRAFQTSIPSDTTQFAPPEARFLYLPRAHVRAIDPDNMLVEGMRGAGKSLWWHALLDEKVRSVLPVRSFGANLRVSAGWSNVPREEYPDRDTIAALMSEKHPPRLIWKTVIAAQVTNLSNVRGGKWSARVGWVRSHPEETAAAFRSANEALLAGKTKHLVLFDALDRVAGDWGEIRALLRGLLENLLELRSSPALRAKAFIRPDMINDPTVQAFPDASKVVASRVSLDWPKADLYGLLFQYLGNADDGSGEFRSEAAEITRERVGAIKAIWQVPDELRSEEAKQRRLLERIAGQYMGADRRRGVTYVWLPNHLADVHGRVSPRSFLSALRNAADCEPEAGQRHALHWNAIKSGVGRASAYRVDELGEDFPWIRPPMRALEDLVVPCPRQDIVKLWKTARVLNDIEKLDDPRRPPHFDREYEGLLLDLQEMGVFDDIGGNRLNIPDVFRIGFGLRRRGGIKPVA